MERLTERAEVDKCPGILAKEGFVNDGLRTWFNGYDEGYSAINKCAEYEDLEEQGKLLKRPCAVGTPVYMIAQDCGGDTLDCRSRDCENCEYLYSFVEENKFEAYMCDEINKTVFLTKEEAEAALKEL